MNLNEWETEALITLWQASDSNLPVKSQIEVELKARSANNKNFCKEDLYLVNVVRNHVLTLQFIPGTQSFLLYGPSITINLKLSDDEGVQFLSNIQKKPVERSFGSMAATPGITGQLKPDQVASLESTGFNTGDIYEILHL